MNAPISEARLVEIVRSLLPSPVRQDHEAWGLVLSGGQPGLVTARIDRAALHIEVFRVHWDGHTPRRRGEPFATLFLKDLLRTEEGLAERLETVIQAAINKRLERFRACKMCGEVNPPEWMHDETTCQSCAERHLGAIY